MKVPAYRVLTNCEPASHASHHVSHARQMLVPSPFSFLRLLAAFGYLARVFAILALLSISFCYLPSSFSSFFKVSYVICYYGGNHETEDKTTLNGHYTCATGASPQSPFRNEKAQKFISNLTFFNICSMNLVFRRKQESQLKKMYENTPSMTS